MHQDLLQFQACQNPLDGQKHKSLRSWYSVITLINALRHVNQKSPISRERFWAIIFSLNRNNINNFGPKGHLYKMILTWEEMLQSERSSMICGVARSRQIMITKKKIIVMSCTWKIRLNLNENHESQIQEKMWEKMTKKLHKHKSFFSCKELLFSLGNCVWNEKWSSFTIPSLM